MDSKYASTIAPEITAATYIPVEPHPDNQKEIKTSIRIRYGRTVILSVPYGGSGTPIVHPLFSDRFGLSDAEVERCEIAIIRKIAIVEE